VQSQHDHRAIAMIAVLKRQHILKHGVLDGDLAAF
jgi:hypothetical protein